MSEKKTVAGLLQAQNEEEGWISKNVVGNAPLIVAAFSNVVVIVSDVRAYDVIYGLTQSIWKALAASFACAIPFIMWEVSWQYNHTTEGWRKGSLIMAGIAFITSIILGVADFIPTADTDATVAVWLLGGVVIATGLHTIVGFLYYYNDPDVARKRRKAQSLAAMLDQEMNAKVAENLLENGNTLLSTIEGLEKKYTPEEVEAVLRILRGDKKQQPTERRASKPQQPTLRYAASDETLPTLAPKAQGPNGTKPQNQP
jgi:hypothetical protein